MRTNLKTFREKAWNALEQETYKRKIFKKQKVILKKSLEESPVGFSKKIESRTLFITSKEINENDEDLKVLKIQ